jgi:membrane protein implicated in regulation of membrane protease activity
MTIMIEYLAQNLWQVWAIIAIACLILELMAGDCFIICFSVGAAVAAVAAAVGLNGYWQLFIFALFTVISLFWFRPIARRYLHKGEDNRVSNADALLGREGRVVETV